MTRVVFLACEKQGGRAQDLVLFAMVDGQCRARKSRGLPVAHFDECQAIAVQHDQVNLAAASTEIPGDRREAFAYEKAECFVLGLVA